MLFLLLASSADAERCKIPETSAGNSFVTSVDTVANLDDLKVRVTKVVDQEYCVFDFKAPGFSEYGVMIGMKQKRTFTICEQEVTITANIPNNFRNIKNCFYGISVW